MIRFHLDQHVAYTVARGLRSIDIDVTTTADAQLQDATDEAHLDFAYREGRVLFTQDRDFLRMHRLGRPHAGIVFAKQGSKSISQIIRFLRRLHDRLSSEEMCGRVEFVA